METNGAGTTPRKETPPPQPPRSKPQSMDNIIKMLERQHENKHNANTEQSQQKDAEFKYDYGAVSDETFSHDGILYKNENLF